MLYHLAADLMPHVLPDASREPVMGAGPDAGARNLIAKGFMLVQRCVTPGAVELIITISECRLGDSLNGAARNAVRARIIALSEAGHSLSPVPTTSWLH